MKIQYLQIDAFSRERFRGNPAVVCLVHEPLAEDFMQSFAAEFNQSETAFLHPESLGGENAYRLRWFTPKMEVDLCGHATLAAAHFLREKGLQKDGDRLLFLTRSGELYAEYARDRIRMEFPRFSIRSTEIPRGLSSFLGAEIQEYGIVDEFSAMAVLKSDEEVKKLDPDFTGLQEVGPRQLIVTARSSQSEFDFISRFFAPNAGIPEDPVTGSAHCVLGPYWGEKLGTTEMEAYQASPRGGKVSVRLRPNQVVLEGEAVTVLKGEFEV